MLSTLQETLVTDVSSEHYDLPGYADVMSESYGSWSWGNNTGCYAPALAMKEFAVRCRLEYSPTHILAWDRPVSYFGESISVRFLNEIRFPHLIFHSLILGSSRSAMIQIEPDWLVMAYKAVDELSLLDIEVIVDGLTKYLSSDRFAEVDIDLSRANPDRMTADAIVTIVHITYPAKNNLRAWQSFVNRSRAVFDERGDEEDHLGGLI